jgi:hypothetical protein
MIDEAQYLALVQTVLWLSFGLTFFLGYFSQSTHFCTMGALADIYSFGSWVRASQVMTAMAISVLGFACLVALGYLDPQKTLYASQKFFWLSNAIGGTMFGAGMVLASGCGNKTLIRMGTGNLKSWVVFVFMGFAALATLKGVTAVFRVNVLETYFWLIPQGADWGHLLPVFSADATQNQVVMGLFVGALLLVLAWLTCGFNQEDSDGLVSWQRAKDLWPGLVVGLIITAAWFLSAHWGHVQENPLTLEEVFLASSSGKEESLTFVSPMAYLIEWLIYFSDQSKVLNYACVCALGVLSGAFVSALKNKKLRWEGFNGVQDVAFHLSGALMMGVGGVIAMGCTFGQGLSSLSTLSLNAFEVIGFIVMGAQIAFRYQSYTLEKDL